VKDEERILEQLILEGAVEVAGIDLETNEPLYNITAKMQDIHPALHDEFINYFSQETMTLWEFGFISMDVTDKNPMIRLTPKALDKDAVNKLDKEHQYTLKEIIRILKPKQD
jgi:hypothetical protein